MSVREDQKLEVQAATDIVRLIGEQVQLRPKGREFACLCPFHDDKNPSMFVSPQKQIYKCFSCGAGGDVFTFVMNYHKMTFPEALEYLAERAGIELKKQKPLTAEQKQAKSDRELLAIANEQAVAYFRALLKHKTHGVVGQEYIEKREINDQMIEDFAVGLSADAWDGLVKTIVKKGWDIRGFELAGLVSRKRDGGYYDRMRHRLIFPIFDAIGRPIAFGGRKLREEDEPKYLNSPETKLFNKSRTLYGLHAAKKPIIDSKAAVIVEGYTDVIACHQAGARNVVATLGTALTREHAAELRRFAEKVVLIFDADEAGQKAADRAAEVFLTGDIDVAIAVLPDGHDPDSLMKEAGGIEKWNEIVKSADDALAFLFARLEERIKGNETVTGRERIADQFIDRLVQMGLGKTGAIRRAMVIQKLSGLLRMNEEAVGQIISARAAKFNQFRRPVQTGESSEAAESERIRENAEKRVTDQVAGGDIGHRLKAVREAERQMIGCLIRDNRLFHLSIEEGLDFDEAVLPAELVDGNHRSLYQLIYDKLCEGQDVSGVGLMADFASMGRVELSGVLSEIEMSLDRLGLGDEAVEGMFKDAVMKLIAVRREHEYEQQRQSLHGGERGSTGSDSAEEKLRLMKELVEHRRMNPSPMRIARFGNR